jgi:hypothetical protein
MSLTWTPLNSLEPSAKSTSVQSTAHDGSVEDRFTSIADPEDMFQKLT